MICAAEYAYTLKVDEKSDVYSFGVVLLELLTGRRPVGDFGEEGLDIVQWTKLQTNWSKEKVVKILDERLHNIPLDEAMQVFFVAMLCVQEQSVERPTMREVVEMLAQAKQPNTFQIQWSRKEEKRTRTKWWWKKLSLYTYALHVFMLSVGKGVNLSFEVFFFFKIFPLY